MDRSGLVNGPASFQGEALPPGVMTTPATLRSSIQPFQVQRLMPAGVPEAWSDGKTTAAALATALAKQEGAPHSLERDGTHDQRRDRRSVAGSASRGRDVAMQGDERRERGAGRTQERAATTTTTTTTTSVADGSVPRSRDD